MYVMATLKPDVVEDVRVLAKLVEELEGEISN